MYACVSYTFKTHAHAHTKLREIGPWEEEPTAAAPIGGRVPGFDVSHSARTGGKVPRIHVPEVLSGGFDLHPRAYAPRQLLGVSGYCVPGPCVPSCVCHVGVCEHCATPARNHTSHTHAGLSSDGYGTLQVRIECNQCGHEWRE